MRRITLARVARPAAILAAALALTASLTACNSTRESTVYGDVNSPTGAFVSGDTSGTQRRPDVNYNFTRPTMPSIVNR